MFGSFKSVVEKNTPKETPGKPGRGGGGGGGTLNKDAHVTSLSLKFHSLLFIWVSQNESYFLG